MYTSTTRLASRICKRRQTKVEHGKTWTSQVRGGFGSFGKMYVQVRAFSKVGRGFRGGFGGSAADRRRIGSSARRLVGSSGGRWRIVGECPRYLSLIGLGSVAVGPMKTSEGSTEKLGN